MQKFFSYSLAVMLIGLLPLAGCADKGAATKTKVVIKPKDSSQSSGQPSGGTQTASTDGAKDAGPVAAGFGTLKGRVVMKGTPPQLELLIRKGANIKDADVCAAEDLPNEKLVVGPNGGVANVFVYLQNAPPGAKPTPPPTDPVVLDQKGCHFIPHALVMQVGRPLKIVSGDHVAHNTHIVPVRNPQQFNEIIEPGSRTGKQTVYTAFEDQPIPVKCDFHAWMSAWQLPLDHPFAAVTNDKGEFEIPNLPAGTYKFKVWHEGSKFLERSWPITIKADAVTETEIPYPVEKFKP